MFPIRGSYFQHSGSLFCSGDESMDSVTKPFRLARCNNGRPSLFRQNNDDHVDRVLTMAWWAVTEISSQCHPFFHLEPTKCVRWVTELASFGYSGTWSTIVPYHMSQCSWSVTIVPCSFLPLDFPENKKAATFRELCRIFYPAISCKVQAVQSLWSFRQINRRRLLSIWSVASCHHSVLKLSYHPRYTRPSPWSTLKSIFLCPSTPISGVFTKIS